MLKMPLARYRLARALSPRPNESEMFAAAPMLTNMPKPVMSIVTGMVTPTPMIAKPPTFGILPIYILSTTL